MKTKNPNVLLIHRPEVGHSTTYEDSKAALEFVVLKALDGTRVNTPVR